MIGSHAYFSGTGRVRLHYRCWDVPTRRAAVLICHGLGEHSGRYERLANDFARAGFSTFALDHRGHGRSDGRRGHVRRFVHYVRDLERFRRRVVGSVGPGVPLIWLGHSMGGLILIRYLEEFPAVSVAGAVLSAPLLGIAVETPQLKRQLARLLRHVVPALPMSTGLDPHHLSHDPDVAKEYMRDPLVHDRITPRLYAEIQQSIALAELKKRQIIVPLLFLIPSADQLVRPDLVQRFAAQLPPSRNVEVKTYAGLYHESLNETTRSGVLADVLGWIERCVGATGTAAGLDTGRTSNVD